MHTPDLRPRRQSRWLITLTLCLAIAMTLSSVASAFAANVTFADKNLESAVRSALAKPTGLLTDTDLSKLTSLTASSRKITSLAGLQYATNLTFLNLSNNAIVSVSPLSGMTKLQTLWLDSNLVSDLTPLQTCTNLGYVQLNRNRISNLTPLGSLKKLSEIRLETNRFTDVTPLGTLPQLRVLYIACNRLRDIAPLGNATALDQLDISQNNIRDVSALSKLTNLHVINMWDNWVSNITPLATLPLHDADVSVNMLDLAPNSAPMQVVGGWLARGAVVEYRPQRVWTLTGTTYKLGGGRLAGVSIWYAGRKITATSAYGTYKIRSGSTGTQKFTFAKRYYYTTSRSLWARAGVTTTLNVVLKPIPLTPTIARYPSASRVTRWSYHGVCRYKMSATLRDGRGVIKRAKVQLQKRVRGTWRTVSTLTTSSRGKVSKYIRARGRSITYWRWYAPATAVNKAKATSAQRIRVR